MSDSDQGQDDKRLFNRSFFVPFGIFNTDKEVEGRSREVLVGRNNQRSSFIRRLLNSGKGGAYLITGQRGTGKTSFVEYCLKVYEEDSVKRFLSGKLNRNMLDNVASIVFVFSLFLLPHFIASLLFYTDNFIVKLMLSVPLLVFSLALLKCSYLSVGDIFFFTDIADLTRRLNNSNVHKPIALCKAKRRICLWKKAFWLFTSVLLLIAINYPAYLFLYILLGVMAPLFYVYCCTGKNYMAQGDCNIVICAAIQIVKLGAVLLNALCLSCILIESLASKTLEQHSGWLLQQYSGPETFLLNVITSIVLCIITIAIFRAENKYIIQPAQIFLKDKLDEKDQINTHNAAKVEAAIGNYYRRLLTHSWLC